MKHFYALALAAAVTLSASAFDLKVDGARTVKAKAPEAKAAHVNVAAPSKAMVKSMTKVADKNVSTGVKSKAVAAADLEGTWIFTLGDFYFQSSIQGYFEAEFEAFVTEVNGEYEVYFEDPTNAEWPFAGYYDAATSTITFPPLILGTTTIDQAGTKAFVVQEPYLWDNNVGFDYVDEIVATVSEDGKSIVFDADNGLNWGAYEYLDNDGQVDIGDYLGVDFACYDLVEAEMAAAWISLGTGQFLDNIFYGLFMEGVGDEIAENKTYAPVAMYAHPDKEGIYKIAAAFQSTFAAMGYNAKSPDLILDASNPDNILVELQQTGVNVQNLGPMYTFNEGWYCTLPTDTGEPEVLDPALACTMVVDVDGNATMTFPYHSFTNYFPQGGENAFYYGSFYPSSVKFNVNAGVNDILSGDENAPVRYYNLQGVEVANPAAGSIYIKVQGKEAKKVLVK